MNVPNSVNERISTAECYFRSQQYDKAFPLYQELAQLGHINCYLFVGWMQLTGSGVTRDEDAAMVCFTRVAAAGNSVGMFYAGKTCLLRNRASDSIPWFQESAARYYAPAQYRLAIAYLYGVGVSPDKAKGNSCLLEAVEAGHLLARGLLARRQLMGAFGLLKIPYGALTAVSTLIDIYRHAQRGDVFDEATSG